VPSKHKLGVVSATNDVVSATNNEITATNDVFGKIIDAATNHNAVSGAREGKKAFKKRPVAYQLLRAWFHHHNRSK